MLCHINLPWSKFYPCQSHLFCNRYVSWLWSSSCMPWNQASGFRFPCGAWHARIMQTCTPWVRPRGRPMLWRLLTCDYNSSDSRHRRVIARFAPDQSPFVTYRGSFGIRLRVQASGLLAHSYGVTNARVGLNLCHSWCLTDSQDVVDIDEGNFHAWMLCPGV